MQIGRHHFFENLFAALKVNDRDLVKNILITELANQIIANTFTVREILAENGVAVHRNAKPQEIAQIIIENFPQNQIIRSKIVDLIFSGNRYSFDGQPHYGTKKIIKWEIISSQKNKILISDILREALLEEKAGKLNRDIIGLIKQVKNKSRLFAFAPEEEQKEIKPVTIGFFPMAIGISLALGAIGGLFVLWYKYIEKGTD